jgi:ATP-dependent Clp protease, protease subunit
LNILVNENTEHGVVPVDIYTRLADHRILFIYDTVDDKLAADIVATLLLKDGEDPGSKITLFINSEGGDIRNIFMIYDLMQVIRCPIETVCVGSAMNESVLLLAAGTKGMRHATANAAICCSQLIQEKYSLGDLANAASVLERLKQDNKNLMSAFAKLSSKKLSEVMADFERKRFFTAKAAQKYGLIDSVIGGK